VANTHSKSPGAKRPRSVLLEPPWLEGTKSDETAPVEEGSPEPHIKCDAALLSDFPIPLAAQGPLEEAKPKFSDHAGDDRFAVEMVAKPDADGVSVPGIVLSETGERAKLGCTASLGDQSLPAASLSHNAASRPEAVAVGSTPAGGAPVMLDRIKLSPAYQGPKAGLLAARNLCFGESPSTGKFRFRTHCRSPARPRCADDCAASSWYARCSDGNRDEERWQ
jgi:hypothetical protein